MYISNHLILKIQDKSRLWVLIHWPQLLHTKLLDMLVFDQQHTVLVAQKHAWYTDRPLRAVWGSHAKQGLIWLVVQKHDSTSPRLLRMPCLFFKRALTSWNHHDLVFAALDRTTPKSANKLELGHVDLSRVRGTKFSFEAYEFKALVLACGSDAHFEIACQIVSCFADAGLQHCQAKQVAGRGEVFKECMQWYSERLVLGKAIWNNGNESLYFISFFFILYFT